MAEQALSVYYLKFPKEGMDIILAGLNELPHKVSRPVFDAVLQQLQAQEAEANALEEQQALTARKPRRKNTG